MNSEDLIDLKKYDGFVLFVSAPLTEWNAQLYFLNDHIQERVEVGRSSIPSKGAVTKRVCQCLGISRDSKHLIRLYIFSLVNLASVKGISDVLPS